MAIDSPIGVFPIPKPKRIPILPTWKWEDGAMAIDSPIGVEVFCCCFCCVFTKP